MSRKIKLTKISLETKEGKEIELSINEARELYSQLESLFGSKTTYIPSTPLIIDRYRWSEPSRPYWSPNTVLCESPINNNNLLFNGKSGLSISYSGNSTEET